jgi:hypothetical protein
MSPGSMPQGATELVQEGLVLPPVRLARVAADGTTAVADDVLPIVLANVRTPGERLGDLRAQLAACAAGPLGVAGALAAARAAPASRRRARRCSTTPSGGRARGSPRSRGERAPPRTRSRATA